jgi:hypothetical protein
MVGKQRPGEDLGVRPRDQGTEPLEEGTAIRVVVEDSAPFQTAGHDVVESARKVEAGRSRHGPHY